MTDPNATPAAPVSDRVPHRWRNLAVLSSASIVDNTEAGLVNNVFPSIAASLRLDSGHLGVIAAVGKLASAPAGPLWVWLATRIGRRWVVALTSFLAGVFGLAGAFSTDFVTLLIFTALMAASAIGGSPVSMAVISDSFPDRLRARAMGFYFASLQVATLALGPVIALFLNLEDGWRWAMGAMAIACFLIGGCVLLLFRDPGVGASDRLLRPGTTTAEPPRVGLRDVLGLFRVPSYVVMMLSRLLSGHLLILIFGVQFLVTERGIDNALAVLVVLPLGVGYTIATLSIGFALPVLDRRLGARGRVLVLQLAQVLFAMSALFATQIEYDAVWPYALLWAAMGACQGLNPPVNRPIVAAIVRPELRGQAFAIWLTIFETIGWAMFALAAGSLAVQFGLQSVFLWILVALMLVNAAVLSVLYVTYPRDVARARATVAARDTAPSESAS
ncbi:MFS transporter [Microbacterium sp. UFMG61]|uniref:MFS transporter n=1 Tax=Microbacterium sp. UFMG61 TaxID=2745935 RepID=UPI001E44AEA2|nr:MFS transporter [Microbacterium sp. UFMG61]